MTDWTNAAGAIALVIGWIGVVWFFSHWIHRAEGNKALTMGLYIVFGAFTGFLFLYGLGDMYRQSREGAEISMASVISAAGAGAAALALIPFTRRALARILPFDWRSKPDMIALALMLGIGAVTFVGLFYETEVEAGENIVLDISVQNILLTILAFFGVGFLTKRSLRETLDRLGVRMISLKEFFIALGLVVVAFGVAIVSALLVEVLQPDLVDQLQDNTQALTDQITSVQVAIFLALMVGIGEETLFRGALQPRFGIIFTSLIFALVHTQYGASFLIVGVFAASVIFGLERKYFSTTACIITHAVYDAIVLSAPLWAPEAITRLM